MQGLRRVSKFGYTANTRHLHLVIEMIYRGRSYFKAKTYDYGDLVLHIPLPLQVVLVQSLAVLDGFPVVNRAYNTVKIFGMKVVPAYENRIVISCPDYAIYDNEPMVMIEFDRDNYPLYYEVEYD